MSFPKAQNATLYKMFDVLLDEGLNLNTDGEEGRSILANYCYSAPTTTLRLVHFFITRGLTDFTVGLVRPDGTATNIPFAIVLLENIIHCSHNDQLMATLKQLRLFETLSSDRTIPETAGSVQKLQYNANTQAGIVFKIFQIRMRTPLSLQEYARNTIRSSLGPTRFRTRLFQLPIPMQLLEYLACECIPEVTCAYDIDYIHRCEA